MQCTGQEDTRRPCGNENIQTESKAEEVFSGEEAAVETDEGDLDYRRQDEIGELAGQEYLSNSVRV